MRGLYRYEIGSPVPETAQLLVLSHPERVTEHQAEIEEMFRSGTTRVIDDAVFFYSFVRPLDQPLSSAWLLVFYREWPVLAYLRALLPEVRLPNA